MLIRNRNLIIVVLLLSSVMISCSPLGQTTRELNLELDYSIMPETLLQLIANGDKSAFSPFDSNSVSTDEYPYSVSWTQVDYFQIRDALYRIVWKEPVDSWKLNYMSFSLPCHDVGTGFQSSNFSLFKAGIERQIDVYPGMKLASAREYIYNSKLSSWKYIDLNDIKISADEALAAAEKSGGREKRLSVNNECEILVILAPNSVDYHGWEVSYSSDTFFIIIDPITGKQVK